MTDNAILTVKDLSIGYDAASPILTNVSFSLKKGEIAVIIGGSGCGKSTLLRNIIGLNRPFSGDVIIEGASFASASDDNKRMFYRRIGVMYQSCALFGSMTLLENVRLPLDEYTDLPMEARNAIATIKLSQVGLSGFSRYMPSEISGGMQKRAAIARAIVMDPQILFLDEPSAGLDPVTSDALDRLILELRDTLGMSVVMVSHELASIFAIADRAIFVDKKTRGILDDGAPRELQRHSAHEEVRDFFNRGRPQQPYQGNHA